MRISSGSPIRLEFPMAGSMVDRRKPIAVALEMVQILRDDACMGGLKWSVECSKGWRNVGPKSAKAKRYE